MAGRRKANRFWTYVYINFFLFLALLQYNFEPPVYLKKVNTQRFNISLTPHINLLSPTLSKCPDHKCESHLKIITVLYLFVLTLLINDGG